MPQRQPVRLGVTRPPTPTGSWILRSLPILALKEPSPEQHWREHPCGATTTLLVPFTEARRIRSRYLKVVLKSPTRLTPSSMLWAGHKPKPRASPDNTGRVSLCEHPTRP